jgi:PAS domain S-box-containing protein
VAFTLVMLGLIALTSFISTQRFLAVSTEVGTVRETLDQSAKVQKYFVDIESGVRAYFVTGQEDPHLNPYSNGLSFIRDGLSNLRKMTVSIPEQQERLGRLQALLPQVYAVHERAVNRMREEIERARLQYRREGKPLNGVPPEAVMAASAHFADPERRNEVVEIFEPLEVEFTEFDGAEKARLRQLRDDLDTIGSVNTSLVMGGTSLTYIALLVACLFVLRDIAERRSAEDALEVERNLLRRIMDTIPDSIYVKDLRGRYTRDNAAHRQHIGRATEDEVIGRTNSDFFPSEVAARYAADDMEVLAGKTTFNNKEEPGITADGRQIWLETTKVPLVGSDGATIGMVGVSTDITQRHADREKLKHFAEALQKSNDELQNFASVASHDLQEPLRKIQAFGDRLRSRNAAELGETALDYLNRMLDAASRMQTLIQDLLKLSRIATRAQPFERCDLAEVVRGVLSDLEVKIAAASARVTVSGLPTIEADPTQMRQLFQNLIANALKFQRPGITPEVVVTARTTDNRRGDLSAIPPRAKICEVRVTDNGIGFAPQFAEQIFSPFKRLHTRTEYEGSGIGLTVCRKITDRHQGRIVAQSAEGTGATFIVTLPVQQPQINELRSEAHNHPDGR